MSVQGRAVSLVCPHCSATFDSGVGRANQAKRIGAPIYCGRVCAGLARRLKSPPTAAERVASKAKYDAQRRALIGPDLAAKKRAYYLANHERVLAAMKVYRKTRMPYHVEYCRRPAYREYKSDYDRTYRAKKDYGEFYEAFLALMDIDREVATRMTRYEISMANGTLNKALTRKRNLQCPTP